jgi:peptidoglycan biosynthesis protein MviN/MurJ (putative lipid II flippase)
MLSNFISNFRDSENVRATSLLFLGILLAKPFGFIRSTLVANLSVDKAEIINASLTLPSDLVAIFILGSIVICTVPNISRLLAEDQKSDTDTVNIYMSWSMLVLSLFIGVLSIISFISIETFWQWLNPKFSSELVKSGLWYEFVIFSRIALISPTLFAIKSILGSFLNIKKRFLIFTLEGILYNISFILGITLFYQLFGLIGVSVSSVFAVSATTIWFIRDAYVAGFKFKLGSFVGLKQVLAQTLILYLPRLFIYSNIRLAERLITAMVPEINGQVTSLQYALDMQGVALGLSVSLATVFLPSLSDLVYKKNSSELEVKKYLLKNIKKVTLLGMAGAFLTIIGAPILLYVLNNLFKINSNSSLVQNAALIITTTSICALSLPFQSVLEVINRYFVIKAYVWVPVGLSLLGTVIMIGVAYLGRTFMIEAQSVAVSFSVSAVVVCVVSLWVIFRSEILKEKTSFK